MLAEDAAFEPSLNLRNVDQDLYSYAPFVRCFFSIYHAAVSGHGLALLGRLIVNAHVARRGCALHLEAQSLTRVTNY